MIAQTESKARFTRFAGPAVILLAAAVAIVPQLIRGNSCGHDFDVHLVSWLDCLNAWRHGTPYPHWAPSPNYGAGEPRFVFYPPLTWMLGAVLGLILPWNLAPIALTFLTLAGTGWATRALALEALDDAPATLAGCAAIFSPFTLFTGYERAAFPEFAGGFWLPLLVLYALRSCNAAGCPIHAPIFPWKNWSMGGNPQTSMDRVPPVPRIWGPGSDAAPSTKSTQSLRLRAFDTSTVPLALALAGAWLSNLPLGVIAAYLLAGVALLWALVNKSWAPILRAAVATILGLGLAAVYWVPAAYERNCVDIRQATQDPGYNFENNWLFSRHANPLLALHDVILRQASWIALSMIALSLAGILIAWWRGTLPTQKSTASRAWRIPLAAIPIVVCFFLFPISAPLWHLLPEMPFLQYPWRWLEAVEAPMAIFVIAAVWPAGRRARIAVSAACAAAFLASILYASSAYFQVCYPEDTVAATLADYKAGAGADGMYEYEPPGGDDSAIPRGLPDACLMSDPFTILGKPDPDDADANPTWSSNQGTCQATFNAANGLSTNPEHRRLDATIPHPGYLVLRLLSFPAWRIRVNGQLLTSLPMRADGLLAVPVSQGPLTLTIDWITTPDVVIARWISILSVFLLTALSLCELRRPPVRLT